MGRKACDRLVSLGVHGPASTPQRCRRGDRRFDLRRPAESSCDFACTTASRGAQSPGSTRSRCSRLVMCSSMNTLCRLYSTVRGADEETRADLGVGEPLAGKLCDLRLLCGEVVPGSSMRFRAVSPVASSSRPARAANASAPIEVNVSRAGRSWSRASIGVCPVAAIRRRGGEREPARTPCECARGDRSPRYRAVQRARPHSAALATVPRCRAPTRCSPRVSAPTMTRSRRSRRRPGRSASRPPRARATPIPKPAVHPVCRLLERALGQPRSDRGRCENWPRVLCEGQHNSLAAPGDRSRHSRLEENNRLHFDSAKPASGSLPKTRAAR